MTPFFRYAIVGILSNVSGYLVYLAITWHGVGPKIAMTGLYSAGAIIGFVGNRQWTFSYDGSVTASIVRYGIAHVIGYMINLAILVFFVDYMGY